MTIVELKDLVEDHFDTENWSINHKLNTLTVYFDETGVALRISITGVDQNRDRIGCHVLIEDASDDWRIIDSIEVALRDSCPSVYIHLNYGKGA